VSATENFRRYVEVLLNALLPLAARLRQAGTRAARLLAHRFEGATNHILAALYEGALVVRAGLNWLRETPERLRRAQPAPVAADPFAAPQSPPPPGPLEPAYAARPNVREIHVRRTPTFTILLACLILGALQIGGVALIVFMMRDAGYSSGWGDAARYYLQCQKAAQSQQWGQ
jgi:hypothetical protein